jgi:cytochrome c-type biogenesis protein CcmE
MSSSTTTSTTSETTTRPRQQGKAKLVLLSIIVAAGAIGTLVYSSMADAEYYKHVHEVMAAPAEWDGRSFKLHGIVEPGSISEQIVGQKTKRTFVLEYEGQRVMVRSEGPKPDTFKDLAEVVATGRMTKEGETYVFVANDLSAKCPSKYEENQRSKRAAPPPLDPR